MAAVDLAILGPGVLGSLVASQWRTAHPTATIALVFRSEDPERRARLEGEGFTVLSLEKKEDEGLLAKNLVFCAPPTGNPQYAAEVERAMTAVWEGQQAGGVAVFTSAGSVYKEDAGGKVDEGSELARTERSGKLMDAEVATVAAGGTVVRLGGLYSEERGAHNFWGKGGVFPSKGNGLINLVHYSDAAQAVVLALGAPSLVGGTTFLVADGCPMTRQAIFEAALLHPVYSGNKIEVKFTGGDEVDGKVYDCQKVRSVLGWQPGYTSFASFMESKGQQAKE